MKKLLFLMFVLQSPFVFCQISLGDEKIIGDSSDFTFGESRSISCDLNNDGFNELVTVGYENKLIWYKNVNGDLQHERKHLLSESVNSNKSMCAFDVDNDSFLDIVVASQFGNKIIWYKNLGTDEFAAVQTIVPYINSPRKIVAGDINNDGYLDIIAGGNNPNPLILYTNNADGTFSAAQNISLNMPTSYTIVEIKLFDIDNDGLLDVFSKGIDGPLYFNKNNGVSGFTSSVPIQYISGAFDSFDFLDINNDNYSELAGVLGNGTIAFYSNVEGILSTVPTISTITTPSGKIVVRDMNNDGAKDIIFSQLSSLGILINSGDNMFIPMTITQNTLGTIKDIHTDDIDNDGFPEIICSSTYNQPNDNSAAKLSFYSYNGFNALYKETVINSPLGAIWSIRIGDMDNDGYNDIVSGSCNVTWNKNIGNGQFSSSRFLETNLANGLAARIELADINNDGLIDIVASTQFKFEFYKNEGNGAFTSVYNIPLINFTDFELVDIDGDNDLDVVYANPYITDNHFGIIKNTGNFTFDGITEITFDSPQFKPLKISCGDIDNDGDIDIVTSSKETYKIHVLTNNGNGNFAITQTLSDVTTEPIDLADIDNDGDIDIISAGNTLYDPGSVYWFRNNSGNFESSSIIIDDSQSLASLKCGDLNNDGYIDIVGVSVEDYGASYQTNTVSYSYNGTTFTKTTHPDASVPSGLDRDLDLGDLDNDGRADVVTSYYSQAASTYFMNNSVLGLEPLSNNIEDTFKLYPNPSSEIISWKNQTSPVNITILDVTGKIIFSEKNYSLNHLDIRNLDTGIYLVKFSTGRKSITKKVVKNK